mmetsp:Transcript_4694/g.16816  ORF Transcript_4694/g.16816 Transcript_4694/m.16816 type:complete len:105 (-) Transcript_4694:546-860(-)
MVLAQAHGAQSLSYVCCMADALVKFRLQALASTCPANRSPKVSAFIRKEVLTGKCEPSSVWIFKSCSISGPTLNDFPGENSIVPGTLLTMSDPTYWQPSWWLTS